MSESNRQDKAMEVIFQYISDTFRRKEAESALSQCQLVCKSWSMPAKSAFYRDIRLTPDRIRFFAINLLATKQTTKPGLYVVNVDFDLPDTPNRDVHFPNNASYHINIILQLCPNIETIGCSTSSSFERVIIWNCLANHLKHLKLFTFHDEWYAANTDAYKQLCLMHKETLIKLQLYPYQRSADDVCQDTHFSAVKENLKNFVSLEELQLCGALVRSPIIADLDDLINDCPCTTHSLTLVDCKFLDDHSYPEELKANNSISELRLQNPKLAATSVRYFADKLAALKTLTLSSGINNLAQSKTQDQYDDWWNQMILLCQPLSHYNISINDLVPGEYLHQIRGCARMAKTIADHAAQQNEMVSTEFAMNLGMQKKYIITMDLNGSCVRLFESKYSGKFKKMVNFFQIFESLQQFSPNTIRICGNMGGSLNFNILSEERNTVRSENGGLDTYTNLKSGVKNWTIFNRVISFVGNKAESVVHLNKMAFPPPPSSPEGSEQINQSNILELRLTECLLYPNSLSNMSLRLRDVRKMIIAECTIKSNSPHQLEIDLPETNLGHLELDLNRVFHAGSLFHLGEHVTIVLLTKTAKTRVSKCMETIDCRVSENAVGAAPSFSADFLISIKCKGLQSLAISGVEVFNELFEIYHMYDI